MGTEQDLNRRTGSTASHDNRDHRDSGDLKRDIDRTRSRMDETIDALSAKLQPRNLVHEALGWAGYQTERSPSPNDTVNSVIKSIGYDLLHSFRDSAKDAAKVGAKKAGVTAWQVARCHPLPSALIGAGVAWLLYEGSCGAAGKARAKGWKIYNPNPEYGGSYVDARTGKAYHEENYGAEWRGQAEGGAVPRSAASTATTGARAVPHTPDPSYGGSYVDARTGEPYNPSTYGQEARSMKNESAETTTGASCPPGYSPSGASDTGSSTTGQGSSGRGVTGYARDTVSGATGAIRGGVTSVTGAARTGVSSVTGAAGSGVSYVGGAARGAASGLTHGVGSAAQTVRHTASSAAHSLTAGASSAAHLLSDTSRTAAHQVRTGYDYSRERAWYAVEHYPLAVGAVALGVGVLFGLALPRTRREEELLGERARQLRERARAASQEIVERGRRAAQETVSAVTEEVRQQGLTPSGLRETARGFVSRVAEDLRHEAEESGLTVGAVKDKARQIAERAQDTASHEIRGDRGGEGEQRDNG